MWCCIHKFASTEASTVPSVGQSNHPTIQSHNYPTNNTRHTHHSSTHDPFPHFIPLLWCPHAFTLRDFLEAPTFHSLNSCLSVLTQTGLHNLSGMPHNLPVLSAKKASMAGSWCFCWFFSITTMFAYLKTPGIRKPSSWLAWHLQSSSKVQKCRSQGWF